VTDAVVASCVVDGEESPVWWIAEVSGLLRGSRYKGMREAPRGLFEHLYYTRITARVAKGLCVRDWR
jgi:hypothetical protein